MPRRRSSRAVEREHPAGPSSSSSSSSSGSALGTPTEVADALQVVLRAIRDGRLVVREDGAPAAGSQHGSPYVPVSRTTAARPVFRDELPNELGQLLARLPEPRRQRKIRSMPARTHYRVAEIAGAQMIEDMRALTPGGTNILVYLASHPSSSVNDLVSALDLKRKTVENLLSILRQKRLIVVETHR